MKTTLLFLILTLGHLVHGQIGLGVLQGTVVDEDQEVIPFARVLVYDLDKLIGATEADFDGYFKIPNLNPGEYEVVFTAFFEGLDSLRLTNVEIYPERITSLGEVTMFKSTKIIDCDFGIRPKLIILPDPFSGTIINPEDIRRP